MSLAIELETARLAEQRGMDHQAIDAFQRVRNLDPSMAGIAHSLAVLYDRLGMTDMAQREYRMALAESPKDANVLCDYGYFLYSTGRSAEAESQLRSALRLAPDHRQATINLATLLGSQKQYEEARILFEQSIGPAAALHNVGMLKLQHGQFAEGQDMIVEAARRDPSIQQGLPALSKLAMLDSEARL